MSGNCGGGENPHYDGGLLGPGWNNDDGDEEEEFDLEIGDIDLPEGFFQSPSQNNDSINFDCEFFLSGAQTACNPQAWKSFGSFLSRIRYDPSRIDGLEMLIDIGGIATDIGSVIGGPYALKFAGAGIAIDVFGLSYQVSKATEGKSSIYDLGVSGSIEVLKESDLITQSRAARILPLGGIVGNEC
jgi:hypothetical protein